MENKELTLTPASFEACDKAYTKARAKFVKENVFYGQLLAGLNPLITANDIPFAAVNYDMLMVNGVTKSQAQAVNPKDERQAFHELTQEVQSVILKHEILHVVFEHLSIPDSFNHDLANIAMDAVINRILSNENGVKIDELPEGCVMPVSKGGSGRYSGFTVGKGTEQKYFEIPDYDNVDWVPIYWHIHDILNKKCGNDCKKLGAAAAALGKLNPMQGDAGSKSDSQVTAKERQQQSAFRQKVSAAMDKATKSRGYIPDGVEAQRVNYGTPVVSWKDYLSMFLRDRITKDDFSNKNNSRTGHVFRTMQGRNRPSVMPKLESLGYADIVLVLDTSGSMGNTIEDGIAEFQSLREVIPFGVHFCACDAEVYDLQSYAADEDVPWNSLIIKGMGGTSFIPPFKMVNKKIEEDSTFRPCAMVYFTDSYGDFPSRDMVPEGMEIIWVVNVPKDRHIVPEGLGTVITTV